MAQTAKILLVEDDTNLGEIYQARMVAEGYIVISARDGEEALALAAKEKPDLIISDVMMPKISGFEMLDILRNTEGLKDTKVIMLTALGQAEDKQRADALHADRYLVKSQVTLEDIVRSAQELLGDLPPIAAAPPAAASPVATTSAQPAGAATPAPTAIPIEPAQPQPTAAAPVMPIQPDPAAASATTTATAGPSAQSSADEIATVQSQIADFARQPDGASSPTQASPVTTTDDASANDRLLADAANNLLQNAQQPQAATQASAATPVPATTPAPETAAKPPAEPGKTLADSAPVAHKKIIRPIDGTPLQPDLNSLLAAEEAKNPSQATGQTSTMAQTPPAHRPGNVFTPASNSDSGTNDTGIDPSSIAL